VQLDDVGALDLAQKPPSAPLVDPKHRLERVERVAADEQRVVDPVTDVGAIVASRRDRSELDITTPLAYSLLEMVIVETPVFTRRVVELLTEEAYRELQGALTNRPMLGAVISGSGGLRKVRWAPPGTGKRGGVRIIYYWAATQDRILMLLVYAKNERDDLSPDQLRVLRRVVETEFP